MKIYGIQPWRVASLRSHSHTARLWYRNRTSSWNGIGGRKERRSFVCVSFSTHYLPLSENLGQLRESGVKHTPSREASLGGMASGASRTRVSGVKRGRDRDSEDLWSGQ